VLAATAMLTRQEYFVVTFNDRIVKDGVDSSFFWSLVDLSKLAAGVKSFMSAIQKQRSTEKRRDYLLLILWRKLSNYQKS